LLVQIEWHLKAGQIIWISDNDSVHKPPLIQQFLL